MLVVASVVCPTALLVGISVAEHKMKENPFTLKEGLQSLQILPIAIISGAKLYDKLKVTLSNYNITQIKPKLLARSLSISMAFVLLLTPMLISLLQFVPGIRSFKDNIQGVFSCIVKIINIVILIQFMMIFLI